jgi:hypothetical protein
VAVAYLVLVRRKTLMSILRIFGLLFIVGGMVCFISWWFRSPKNSEMALHPLFFTGFACILGNRFTEILKLETGYQLLWDCYVLFGILFVLVLAYLRLYSSSQKFRESKLQGTSDV